MCLTILSSVLLCFSSESAPRPISSAGQSIALNSSATLASTAPAPGLVKFQTTSHMTFKPVIFRPNGSFRVLKETGKLRCEPHEAAIYQGRNRNDLADTPHFIPGYTGFVRSSQHIAGRTYGDATRRALTEDYRSIVSQSPIPSSPQNNRKIPLTGGTHTWGTSQIDNRVYHVPGYTGFVPGVRQTFGKGYGQATTEQLSKTIDTKSLKSTGFADTAIRRSAQKLESNPLPGGSATHEAPEMYVPSHVKHLRYMS